MSSLPGAQAERRRVALRKCVPVAFSVAVTLAWSLFVAAHGTQVDIGVYRFGGLRILHPDLYSARLGTLYFTYPPFAALVFALPSLAFSTLTLQVLWALANVVALAGLTYVSIRITLPRIEKKRALWWAMLLLTPALALDPVFINFGLGQINLVLTLMIVWDLASEPITGTRRLPLGVATGIAAAIKLTPLIFVPYLLITRRIRGAFNAAATFLICEGLAYLVAPHDSWVYWTKDVFDSKRAGALLYTSDQNLTSVLQRFHHGAVPSSVTDPAIAFLSIAGLLVAAWAYRRSSMFLGLLVCAATELIVSPITWVHHLVWIVPALIWLARGSDRPRKGPIIAAVTAFVFVIAPIWWVPRSYVVSANPPELHEHGWQLVAGNIFFLATIAFLVGVAAMLWMRARSSRGHVGEHENGLPVPGGSADVEAPLEGGVRELRPSVPVGAKQVDLAAVDAELIGPVTSRQFRNPRGGGNCVEEGHMQIGEVVGPVEKRIPAKDAREIVAGPENHGDVET
jgi:alpha-1,2-mannosyltransferase